MARMLFPSSIFPIFNLRFWRVFAHGDDDCANQCRREQQALNAVSSGRTYRVINRSPMFLTVAMGRGRHFLGQAGAVQRRPAERGKDDGGHPNAEEPTGRKNGLVRCRIASRQQHREHDQDGNRADIDQNLGEPDELRAERPDKAPPARPAPPPATARNAPDCAGSSPPPRQRASPLR